MHIGVLHAYISEYQLLYSTTSATGGYLVTSIVIHCDTSFWITKQQYRYSRVRTLLSEL